MAQVLNEVVNLAVAPEVTLGVQPTANWINVQPNSKGDIGSSIKKIARTPVSKTRQNEQSIIVDLDAAAPWEADVTKDLLDNFMSGIFMSAIKHSGNTGLSFFRPTGVTSTGYTVASLGALSNNLLVYSRGWQTTANNGLKLLAGTSIGTEIKTTGLTAEAGSSANANATVEVCGVQASVAADIQMDNAGNLISTALDWTTCGLVVGGWIYIPPASHGASFTFANTAYTGFARIKTIAATKLTLEWRSWTVGALDAAAGKTIRVFFGRYARNVSYDHADFLKPSYQFELTYPDLNAVGVPEYEYVTGCLVDEWKFNLPLTSKATANLGFVGMDAPNPSTTRATGGSAALNPVTNVAVSTATDLMRLRISNVDETGISTDFKNVTITIKNNVNPEKVLGTLVAKYMNVGRLDVMIDADLVFTSSDVIKAVRDNRQVHMDFVMRNGDFAALIDIMAASVMNTDRNFPTNASVQLKTQSGGFRDATLGSTIGMTIFPYAPV